MTGYRVWDAPTRFRDATPLLPEEGAYSEYVTYIMYGCSGQWNDLIEKLSVNYYPNGIVTK